MLFPFSLVTNILLHIFEFLLLISVISFWNDKQLNWQNAKCSRLSVANSAYQSISKTCSYFRKYSKIQKNRGKYRSCAKRMISESESSIYWPKQLNLDPFMHSYTPYVVMHPFCFKEPKKRKREANKNSFTQSTTKNTDFLKYGIHPLIIQFGNY